MGQQAKKSPKKIREDDAERSGREKPTPREWNPKWMPRFVEVLRETGVARAAMRAVAEHVRSTRTFYRYYYGCQRFKKDWDAAVAAHRASSKAKPALGADRTASNTA